MITGHMFGFRKKVCAVCGSSDVINVGKPTGYLCERHMLGSYEAKFLAHSGRKIVILPAPSGKYISYQYETVARLRSYGLNQNDVAPVETVFSNLAKGSCYLVQSEYEPRDFLNLDFFETAKYTQETRSHLAELIVSTLPQYMNSNGVALPPDGDEDLIFYSLHS